MILNKFTSLLSIFSEQDFFNFNSSLPVELKVLKKLSSFNYLIKVGKQSLDVRSDKALILGFKYWAELSSKDGDVLIQNLTKKPEFLQNDPIVFIDFEDFRNLFEDDKFSYKNLIMKQLANSNTKEEFEYLNSILLACLRGVYNIPIKYDDKYAYFQVKKNKNILNFYASFFHLGPLSGTIFLDGEDLNLNLFSKFKSSYIFLKRHIGSLEFFTKKTLNLKKDIKEFLFFNTNLLDIKG